MFHDAGDDPDYRLIHVNYPQNPFCPQLLKDEAARHLRRDPDSYAHVWLGQYNLKSDDQVLAGKCITQDFEPHPDWSGPYLGADWGFSADPDTLIECYIDLATNKLYIRHELYKVGVEINDTPEFWDNIPNAKKHTVRADCARPEVISYMKHHGYPKTVSVEKWAGSVEDGISTLRGFEQIVIHSDCTHTAEEARLWKYKRDRLTDDVLPVLIDKYNHCWDAIRYALAPIIKQGNSLGDLLDMAMGR
jgi:phage terminase large subunit